MIRLLNLLFFGLAILFFAVLGIGMCESIKYVNNNSPFDEYEQSLAAGESTPATSPEDFEENIPVDTDSVENNNALSDTLSDIDMVAIDSLLDDDKELDALLSQVEDSDTTSPDSIIENVEVGATPSPQFQPIAEATSKKEVPSKKTSIPKREEVPKNYNRNGRYVIAVGTFRERANARDVLKELNRLGFDNIGEKRNNNTNFTSITLTGYSSRASASRDLTKVKRSFKEAYIRMRK